MLRRALLAMTGIAVIAAGTVPAAAAADGAPDGHYRGNGDPGGFHNIVPPGQDGVLNGPEAIQASTTGDVPPHFQDQLQMYADLILDKATPGFTADKLDTYYKDASFGVKPEDVGRVYSPGGRDDVTVVRDKSFGVPHIYGDTREGAMYADGYTAAEDRLFLMDVLRHVGRAQLAAFLGASEGNLHQDAEQMAAAPYTEQDLHDQIEAIKNSDDPTLRQVYVDGKNYVDGVNRYISEALTDPSKLPAEYPALQQVPSKFVPEDIVAIASLVGGIFGKGGGREVANYCGIQQLSSQVGPTEARTIFDDFHLANDAEAPTTVPNKRFDYMSDLGPVDQASIPQLDCSSLHAIQAPPPGPDQAAGTVENLVPNPPLPAAPSGGAAAPGTASATSATDAPSAVHEVDTPWGTMPLTFNSAMSNAVLVSGAHTDTGNPIAVFGPQTGYFAPQLLRELDIHAPGIDARGVAFAGTDIYVQLGRGRDYAWSATSASADLVDQFVVELCDPDGGQASVDSMGYVYDGQCKAIESHQQVLVAKPSAGGMPIDQNDPQPPSSDDVVVNKYFERAPDYGPISARGTLTDGTPIAIAVERTTYGSELASARGFQQINDPDFMKDGVDSFRRAMGQGVDYTFNWFYVDRDHVAYQHSCLCPLRAKGTDPYLPTWGNGQWDWTGRLGFEDEPHATDPGQGYLVSWNNKQAPGFTANDGQFGYGPIHRSTMLERRIKAKLANGHKVEVGDVVDVMALAATTDLRAQEIMPLLERVMGSDAPGGADPRVTDMWDRLQAWAADDLGHRRDHDGDGQYEHAQAVAIMDAWWSHLYDAMFKERSANAREVLGIGLHDAPQNHLGSAFQDKVYAHVDKDLRQVLGDPVKDPFSRTYCGGGDLATCRSDLWASLSQAAGDLENEFGSSNVDDWQRTIADDAIKHQTVGVVGVPDIPWQNRPTFQQVVQIPVTGNGQGQGGPGHGPSAPAAPANDTVAAGATLPSTGADGGVVSLGLGLVGLAGLLDRRRRRT